MRNPMVFIFHAHVLKYRAEMVDTIGENAR
jgi:hypothetical protein